MPRVDTYQASAPATQTTPAQQLAATRCRQPRGGDDDRLGRRRPARALARAAGGRSARPSTWPFGAGHTDGEDRECAPEQLGKVEIRLRYEAGGVTASVTAESRAATAALTAQAPDLRRALESQGLTVLGLDVQQSGVGAETTPDRDRLGTFGGPQAAGGTGPDEADDTTTTTIVDVTSLPLADGQVDVLA